MTKTLFAYRVPSSYTYIHTDTCTHTHTHSLILLEKPWPSRSGFYFSTFFVPFCFFIWNHKLSEQEFWSFMFILPFWLCLRWKRNICHSFLPTTSHVFFSFPINRVQKLKSNLIFHSLTSSVNCSGEILFSSLFYKWKPWIPHFHVSLDKWRNLTVF